MNKAYNQVKKFHEASGIEMPKQPTMLEGKNLNSFYVTEISSLSYIMKKNHIDGGETKKRASYFLEEIAEFLNADTIEDQADSLTDLIYFAIGTFTLMGVQPERIFDIVANANLGKIMPDGTVLRDDQGKIMKPEGWKEKYSPEPLIKAEIEQQTRTAECKTCNGTSQSIYGLNCHNCN